MVTGRGWWQKLERLLWYETSPRKHAPNFVTFLLKTRHTIVANIMIYCKKKIENIKEECGIGLVIM